MRRLPWMMLAVGLVLSAAPLRAQTYDPSYPVCLKIYPNAWGGGGDYNECTYTSMAQCQASASGRAAMCVINPYYAPQYRTPPDGYRRRHRHAY